MRDTSVISAIHWYSQTSHFSPVQALIDWFPDKKGLASGLVIAGFGSGAIFFTPLMNHLMAKYNTLPQVDDDDGGDDDDGDGDNDDDCLLYTSDAADE